ncbi:MAG: helical backbone metal receptor [Dokdonia sp.]|jgi:ABC-type Fe3+-hydroxamate transport system substrate-binding protein
MIHLKDQLGQELSLKDVPKRIVSLVPSQTELLVYLGLREELVGVTKFCVHPKGLKKEKTVVGGTKSVHYDKIASLQPDIILCNKEENTKEMVLALKEIAPVHTSDVITLEDHNELIRQYGKLFAKEAAARQLQDQLQLKITAFSKEIHSRPQPRVGYLIWKNPYMAAGNHTFINSILALCGFENGLKQLDGRYPELTLHQIQHLDYLLLSSEPFPFKEDDLQELTNQTEVPAVLVDGEYFSWYGSRLLQAFTYFEKLRKRLEL